MNKLVVLNLGKGNLQNGFPIVVVQLREAGNSNLIQFTGSLSAAPEIIDGYRRWQLLYEMLYEARYKGAAWRQKISTDDDIEIDDADVTHVSDAEFFCLSQQLQTCIDHWLDSQEFRPVERQLRMRLAISDEIRVVIQTEDNQVRKLPWHLWNFFKDYPQAEVALSTLDFGWERTPDQTAAEKVRVLAVLGDRTGIDIDTDRRSLENLPHAEVVFLVEPQRQELDEQLWDRQGWDILFFAGHSSSQRDGETGEIYINSQASLTITQLKNALKTAISRRLQLAIFNSCDGLGLGRELAFLQIPQMIVMREPVPDKVAQEFLKYFLRAFSAGDSFYLAVREARERLQGLESDFPGASWLPVVICQNLAAEPPSWEKLRASERKNDCQLAIAPPPLPKPKLQTAFIISLIVTSLVMGVRSLGWLQSWELNAYDQMMRQRSLIKDEGQDDRLLIVKVTEQDIQQLKEYPLTDKTIVNLVKKLEKYQPRVIGLDIYRDLPREPGHADFVKYLQQSDRFIAVCEVGGTKNNPGIAPPSAISEKPLRLGFTDFIRDSDGIIRRNLLAMGPESSPCQTDKSFSLQLARRYLLDNRISLKLLEREKYFQLGAAIFKSLDQNSGGYHQLDPWGYQVLLNYRSTRQIAPEVKITEVLHGKINANLVKNRIVLIGATAKSAGADEFSTPYDPLQSPSQRMPGLMVHAHQISQIISAVLNNRGLLWIWPKWGELLWILFWSLVGGILSWQLRSLSVLDGISRLPLVLAFGLAGGTLYILCFTLLLSGGWVPLVPSALALVVTSGVVIVYNDYQNYQLYRTKIAQKLDAKL